MCGRNTQKLTWSQIHDFYSLRELGLPSNLRPYHNGATAQDFAARRFDGEGVQRLCPVLAGACPFLGSRYPEGSPAHQ